METTRPVGSDFPPMLPPSLKDEEKIVCPICGKDHFRTQRGLKTHLTTIHHQPRSTKIRKRKRRAYSPRRPKAVEFPASEFLLMLAPGDHIPAQHFDRISAWLQEARELHGILQTKARTSKKN